MLSRRTAVALLLGATLLAYLPALQAGFIWDDDSYLTTNPTVQSPAGLASIWIDRAANPQYYPLTFTSFWIEHRLWGLEPFGYHLVNVLLHALAAILLWQVLRELELEGALLAAALFALHPVAVESVAWITERKNTLSAVFYLGAALVYLRGRSKSAFALYACALLSKSVTASLPVVLLLVIAWKRGRGVAAHLPRLGAMTAMGLVAGLHTAWLERQQVGAIVDASLGLVERGLLAGRIFWFYLGKLLLPVDLAFFYPRWEVDGGRSAPVALSRGRADAARGASGASFADRPGACGRAPLLRDHALSRARLSRRLPDALLLGRRPLPVPGDDRPADADRGADLPEDPPVATHARRSPRSCSSFWVPRPGGTRGASVTARRSGRTRSRPTPGRGSPGSTWETSAPSRAGSGRRSSTTSRRSPPSRTTFRR